MPGLFSPFSLKSVTLRNRIVMSPMTMYRAVDGHVSDYHVMLAGSRAGCPHNQRKECSARHSARPYGQKRQRKETLGRKDPTDAMESPPFNEQAFMVERAGRLRREIGIPVGVSWNLGVPRIADQVVRDGHADLIFLGRPALANPHWPVWAARALGHQDPFP